MASVRERRFHSETIPSDLNAHVIDNERVLHQLDRSRSRAPVAAPARHDEGAALVAERGRRGDGRVIFGDHSKYALHGVELVVRAATDHEIEQAAADRPNVCGKAVEEKKGEREGE